MLLRDARVHSSTPHLVDESSAMEIMTSPYKNAADSPSRQLLYELSRLGISNQENFYARLDRESKEREAVHREALAAAAAEHDRIRRNAENEREKLELQLQAEQRRREEEERKELEKIRQERAEREIAEKRREIERAKTAELEARRLDEARRAAAAAASAAKADKERRDAEAAETARQLKEAQDARAREKDEAKHAEKRAKDAALLAQKKANEQLDLQNSQASLAAQPIRKPTRNPQREAEHQRYVEIHQNLKKLRKFMMAEAQKQPAFKQRMGDLRREIKKCVGQLIEGKGVNKVPVRSPKSFQRRISLTTQTSSHSSWPSLEKRLKSPNQESTLACSLPPDHSRQTPKLLRSCSIFSTSLPKPSYLNSLMRAASRLKVLTP